MLFCHEFTPEEHEIRRKSMGGSDANRLFMGHEKVMEMWLEKTGQKKPENLMHSLPVQLGNFTEPFHRFWFTRKLNIPITDVGLRVVHPETDYLTCTLDGRCNVEGVDSVWEAKFVGGYEPLDKVINKYMPQLQHNMHVCGLNQAVLSVIIGNARHEWVIIPADPFYTAYLLDEEARFWNCVQTGTPPGGIQEPPAQVDPSNMRDVDMTGNNEFAMAAADYLENEGFAKKFDDSIDTLKSLVPDDAKLAKGYGLVIKRSKNGALKISKVRSKKLDKSEGGD